MGVDIRENPTLARSYLGYMAQKFSLYGNMTVRENLEFFAGIYGIPLAKIKERVDSIASYFGLTVYFDQLSEKLPLGIKQRLSLACALIHNPPILFLDEATSGVDVVTRKEFWCHLRALAQKGVTILITTHFMDEAEYCDNISLFYQGETIAVGTPAALKAQALQRRWKMPLSRLLTAKMQKAADYENFMGFYKKRIPADLSRSQQYFDCFYFADAAVFDLYVWHQRRLRQYQSGP